jgi:hypothetical protein
MDLSTACPGQLAETNDNGTPARVHSLVDTISQTRGFPAMDRAPDPFRRRYAVRNDNRLRDHEKKNGGDMLPFSDRIRGGLPGGAIINPRSAIPRYVERQRIGSNRRKSRWGKRHRN